MVERDELFADNSALHQQLELQTGGHIFNINAYTVGYTRDIGTFYNVQTGIGRTSPSSTEFPTPSNPSTATILWVSAYILAFG